MSASRQIKFGIRIHQAGYGYQELKEVWLEGDRLGYHSATLIDLLSAPTLECWTTLAAMAGVTRKIRLVPLVLANLYRHPAVLAKMAATLDVISGGRFELGIGAGGDRSDHMASGLPFPPTSVRVAMLEEAVEVIKGLWSGKEISFKGHYYTLDDARCAPTPVQKPRPPILIGGHGETHLLRAVAMHGDICNMRFDMSLEDHYQKRRILEEQCNRVGRDPSEIETSHNANVLIAEDRAALGRLLSSEAQKRGMSVDDFRKTLGNSIVGTPEHCAIQLRRYVECGVTYFFLLFPHPIDLSQVRLFSREVIPVFRK